MTTIQQMIQSLRKDALNSFGAAIKRNTAPKDMIKLLKQTNEGWLSRPFPFENGTDSADNGIDDLAVFISDYLIPELESTKERDSILQADCMELQRRLEWITTWG